MSKYKNRKVIHEGIKFDSIREKNYYIQLCMLKRASKVEDRVVDIQLQPEFELQPAYKKGKRKVRAIKYRADFWVMYADGYVKIIDVKGIRTSVYRLKKKLFEYKYPRAEIVEV